MNKLKLGVCYYPEHWDRSSWPRDLDMMQELGIGYIRLAEFAWGKMQPGPDKYDFTWLDEVINMAAERGIKVTLCTPTATPPAWLVNKHPDILPVGEDGQARKFGSRRHYSFNSASYREYSRAITEKMAERYGGNPTVAAWQTDNELSCHDTTRSYGEQDRLAFHQWLTAKYGGDIAKLNLAWGNDFWDQNYGDFAEIPLPNFQVAQFNPAHRLDFYRFSSDALLSFNKEQTDILRKHCPGQPITHNMMGFAKDFDHFAMGEDLDFACWDNYPLGYLEEMTEDVANKKKYYNIGDPDISAFYHDLYRGIGNGRLWIMEQQPGPVNWANYNPVPAEGAVKFWTWQAFAHGAELVSYFRWRQAPFAQEQMHAGILNPDSQPARAHAEVLELGKELQALPELERTPADVALVHDYESLWFFEILPQSAGFSAQRWALDWYSALRCYGLNVDIVSAKADLSKYKLVVVPSMVCLSEEFMGRVETAGGATKFLWGPRTGSKVTNFAFPDEMPPGGLNAVLPLKVTRVASLRPECNFGGKGDFGKWNATLWREYIETGLPPRAKDDKGGIFFSNDNHSYLAARLDKPSLMSLVALLLKEAKVSHKGKLKEGVRVCSTNAGDFVFDFAKRSYKLPKLAKLPKK